MQMIIAISGLKHTGKTTLIESMIPYFKQRGLGVAVIKHDGHEFIPDVPNTDTYRFYQNGADATVVYSGTQYMLVERKSLSLEQLSSLFASYDIILLEGQKYSDYPKLELVEDTTVCNPQTVLAYVGKSFVAPAWLPDKPYFERNDIEGIVDFLLQEQIRCDLRKK